MELAIYITRPEGDPKAGPVTVGWFLNSDKAGVVYYPPERVRSRQTSKMHAKSAARCPGVIQLESRYFMVRCPFDLHIGFGRDDKGRPHLINRAGAASGIRSNKLEQVLKLVPEVEWRYPDRPTVQLFLPYCFVAEEVCYITQLDAFAHYRPVSLPGTIFGGRFPIHAWVRPLMWAFEWHDIGRDLIVKRGDPLFYCQFEADGPDRPISLVEIERTQDIEHWMEQMSGVVNFVNQTFSLFKAAEEMRPANLIVPKAKGVGKKGE
jgi:hypothetical protein